MGNKSSKSPKSKENSTTTAVSSSEESPEAPLLEDELPHEASSSIRLEIASPEAITLYRELKENKLKRDAVLARSIIEESSKKNSTPMTMNNARQKLKLFRIGNMKHYGRTTFPEMRHFTDERRVFEREAFNLMKEHSAANEEIKAKREQLGRDAESMYPVPDHPYAPERIEKTFIIDRIEYVERELDKYFDYKPPSYKGGKKRNTRRRKSKRSKSICR
jgi:single-stranded DNA-specific DHH superfamily exonuclease